MDRCMEISESEKKVLHVMENPKGVDGEEIGTLQGESLRDCRLLDTLSLLLEEEAAACPDIDQELLCFHRKRQREVVKHLVIGWSMVAGVVAASLSGDIFG